MPSMSAIALSGMSTAQVRLQASAHNIANLGSAGFTRQQVVPATAMSGGVRSSVTRAPQPGPALEADLVDQIRAKADFLANLAVFRASDRMLGSLLDATG